jgi:cell division septum initiation protein DivIVA
MYKQWLRFKSNYIFKTALLEAVRKDLENALEQNDELREVNLLLTREVISLRNEIATFEPKQEWWEAQDRELAMQEAEERADEISIDYIPTRHKDKDEIPF